MVIIRGPEVVDLAVRRFSKKYKIEKTISMKTTNRLVSLFAAILTTATLMAEVVYEPLEVASGFNRDVIAEAQPVSSHAWSPMYDLTSADAHRSCSATKEVMVAVNQASSQNFSENDMLITERCGWPNDYRDTIRCEENANTNPEYANVKFLLAPYNGENALCLRPDEGFQKSGTLHFKKIGCYNKLYFLMISMQVGGNKDNRRVDVRLYYTNGDTKDTTFNFVGLSGEDGKKFHLTNIYEYGDFRKNTGSQTKAFACIYDIAIADSLLIDSIWFQNPKTSSAVEILAVTGRTADMEIPEEESMDVSNIDKTSFQACWDAITEAASYRIDVATDIDFQHILEDYNNLPVSGSTCQDIVDLVSNTDYYWRVRSVNSDGGQSASSAPHRVKTAPDKDKGDTPPYTDEEYTNIEENLAPYIGTKSILAELDIHRTLYRDGAFNTLCLPFDMNATQIATSPLAGVQVYEFVHAEKNPSGQLDIEINGPIDHITAGVPYLVKWNPTDPEIIDGGILVFKNVNVVTNHGQTLGEAGEVQFVGNIGIATMEENNENHVNNLFLGAANTLYWPENSEHETRLKGFRAYFIVPEDGPSGAPKHTPARIVMHSETTTDIERIENSEISVQKVIRDGQMIILREGKQYSVLGQIIQ